MLKNKKTRDFSRVTRTLLPRNRSAQVGETVSWIIATLIIIGILLIFIWISVLMAKVKTISLGDSTPDAETESTLIEGKISMAHQLANNKNKNVIDNILKENG